MLVLDRWRSEVLTSDDRVEWHALVEAIPHRDVFFTPEYVIPFERLSRDRACLFFFGDEANYILYPFFLRRINDLAFYQVAPLDSDTEYFDVMSPYGYSGPIAHITHPGVERNLWRGYLDAFHHYCVDNNIVCEFARLNPFVGNHAWLQKLTDGIQATGEIIFVDLQGAREDIWRGLNRGNRSSINKARRLGVEIFRGHDKDRLRRFYELYAVTMHRNQASQWYYFSPTFFMDGFELLGDKISLFYAAYQGQMIAAISLLHDGDVVHYFLGGSDSSYSHLRSNNLLMYEAICWAQDRGYRFFNLGGRYGSKESLVQFKAAFSKQTTTFYTYRRVHLPMVYIELVQRYLGYMLDAEYFPLYRASSS